MNINATFAPKHGRQLLDHISGNPRSILISIIKAGNFCLPKYLPITIIYLKGNLKIETKQVSQQLISYNTIEKTSSITTDENTVVVTLKSCDPGVPGFESRRFHFSFHNRLAPA